MGFLLFAGMVYGILASGYTVKEEIKCATIDGQMKAHYDSNFMDEQDKIKYNFTKILKRCRVKYNKATGRPIEYKPLPCVAYLRKQGYKEKETNFFQRLYDQKYEEEKNEHFNNINKRHQTLKNDINQAQTKKYYTFNITNYHEKTERTFKIRAEKLLKNALWRKLVNNYTYYYDNHNLVEVWNLYIPSDMREKTIRKIYMEVCEQQNVHNSLI